MAQIYKPTEKQQKVWRKWVESRPANVRAVADRLTPWTLYRMISTGHRVTVASYGEMGDGTVSLTVHVSAKHNLLMFERGVFGVDPDDLVECDLPSAEEVTGSVLSQAEVEDNLGDLRLMVRPDLWEKNEAGEVVRKTDQPT